MIAPKGQITVPESSDCMIIRIPSQLESIIPRQLESIQRSPAGWIELQETDAKVEYLVKVLHEHEGAHALYER